MLFSFDAGAQGIEASLDVFVTAVYLFDVINATGTIGTHGGNEQGDTCTDVRAGHTTTTQADLPVVSHYDGSVRVAEDDLGAHVDELVNEEQAALEHLLMEKYRAAGLCRHDDEH